LFKKWVNFSKKKTAGVVLAGTLAVGAFSGTAYAAYEKNWDDYIISGINELYQRAFPEIEKATEEKKNTIVDNIKIDIRTVMDDANDSINDYKQNLIEENMQELEQYYNDVKANVETTADGEIEEKKNELERKADESLEKAKQNINKEIEKELKKY
jgi:hypothetical protein